MSSPKRKFFGIVLTTIACVGLMLAMVITGCGGSNNPSGPASSAAVSSNPLQSTTGTPVSIKGRVVSTSNAPLGGVTVSLYYSNNGVITDTGATAVSTTAGEFIFSGLASGVYIIKSASNTQYLESSKLGDASAANADVGDLLLLPQVTTSTTPTLDITGTIQAALTNSPLSAAQVFVDTGYATVTNVNGQFTLPYVERGIRTVKIEKPGFGSTTITLEVKGEVIGSKPPTAQEITYGGQTLTPVAPATRTIDLGIKIALFEIHENGILAGTVQRYVPNADGTPSAAKQAYPNFNFDLWVILPDKSATPWGTVVTNTDGTWQKVAPPNADNKFEWVAVVPNTQSQTAQDGSGGNVTTWVNANWSGNPILSRGWLVEGGKTTIMDFDVWDPSFVVNTSIKIATATNLVAMVNGAVQTEVNYIDNIDFQWNGPVGASNAQLIFTRTYDTVNVSASQSIAIPINGVAIAETNSYAMIPSDIGLDWGPYQWYVGVKDPTTKKYAYSKAKTMAIRPSNDSLFPANGERINVSAIATNSVHFRFPYDDDTNRTFVELRAPNDSLVTPINTNSGSSANAGTSDEITYSWRPGAPTVGTYRWRVHYYYTDGYVMRSEYQTLIFQ